MIVRPKLNAIHAKVTSTIIIKLGLFSTAAYPRSTRRIECRLSYSRRCEAANSSRTLTIVDRELLAHCRFRCRYALEGYTRHERTLFDTSTIIRIWIISISLVHADTSLSIKFYRNKKEFCAVFAVYIGNSNSHHVRPLLPWHHHVNSHDTHPPIAYFTTPLVSAHPDTHSLAIRP